MKSTSTSKQARREWQDIFFLTLFSVTLFSVTLFSVTLFSVAQIIAGSAVLEKLCQGIFKI